MGALHEGAEVDGYQGYLIGRWNWGLLEDMGGRSAHKWLGQHLRAHLLCRIIVFWLPRLVEVQHGVRAQTDSADGRVVQWPILVGLRSGYQGWTGQESTPPLPPSGVKGGLPSWGQGGKCLVGLCELLNESGRGST